MSKNELPMEYKYEIVDAGGKVVCSEGGKRKVRVGLVVFQSKRRGQGGRDSGGAVERGGGGRQATGGPWP